MDEADKQQTILLYDGMFEEAYDEEALSEMLISPTRQAVYLARSYNNRVSSMDLQIRSRYVETYGQDKSLPSYIRAVNRIYEDAEKRGLVSPENLDVHKYEGPEPDVFPEELDYLNKEEPVPETPVEEIPEVVKEVAEPVVEELAEAVEPELSAEEAEKKTIEGILTGIAATMAALVGKNALDDDEDEDEDEPETDTDIEEDEIEEISEVEAVEEAFEEEPVPDTVETSIEEPVEELFEEEEAPAEETAVDEITETVEEVVPVEELIDEIPSFDDIMAELTAGEEEASADLAAPAVGAAVAAAAVGAVAAAVSGNEGEPSEPDLDSLLSSVSEDSSLDDLLAALTSDKSLDSVLSELAGDTSLDELMKDVTVEERPEIPDFEAPPFEQIDRAVEEPVEEVPAVEAQEEESDPFVIPEAKEDELVDYTASLLEKNKLVIDENDDENYDDFADLKPRKHNYSKRSLDPAVQAILEGKSLKEARAMLAGDTGEAKPDYLASGKKNTGKINGGKVALLALPALLVTLLVLGLLLIPLGLTGAGAAMSVALGVFCFGAAFSGFSIVADILIILGAAVIFFALGLLLAWCFVWLLIGVVPAYFRGLTGFIKKLCAKKGE